MCQTFANSNHLYVWNKSSASAARGEALRQWMTEPKLLQISCGYVEDKYCNRPWAIDMEYIYQIHVLISIFTNAAQLDDSDFQRQVEIASMQR